MLLCTSVRLVKGFPSINDFAFTLYWTADKYSKIVYVEPFCTVCLVVRVKRLDDVDVVTT